MSQMGRASFFLMTCGVLALWGQAARGDEIVGPEFGNNRFTSEISTVEGGQDTDDFVADLQAGETVSLTVSATSGGLLLPAVQIIAPDGTVVPTRNVRRAGGRSVSVKFEAGATGRWATRISGRNGTVGKYLASFRVTQPKSDVDKNVPIGGAAGTETTFEVEAVDGATLIAQVSWPRGKPAVKFRSLTAPDGSTLTLPAGTPIVSTTKFRFKAQKLDQGSGTYELNFGLDAGAGLYTISSTVRPPARPTGTNDVDPNEPQIGLSGLPISSVAGQTLTFTGQGFSTGPGTRVLFGETPGTNVTVNPSGTSLTVVVPPGTDGATVALTIENGDGQAIRRENAFFYIPAPAITNLVDASGILVRGGSTAGGNARTLIGTGFSAGMTLTLNAIPATISSLDGSTSLDFTSPAGSAGFGDVVLTDSFGRTATAPFSYAFKLPPIFGNPAYDPPFGGRFGGTDITISGSRFEATDRLYFDGSELPLTVLSSNQATFTSPYGAAGNHTLSLRDRFGTVVTGPAFEVKTAPTAKSISYVSGAFLGTNEIPLAGGTVLQIDGSGFRTSDLVTVDGEEATVVSATDTALQFTTPAGEPGLASVVVTDAAGQGQTLTNALRFVGFADASSERTPEPGEGTPDYGATASAVGDLDSDGLLDDLITTKPALYAPQYSEYGRMFTTRRGVLQDRTGSKFTSSYYVGYTTYTSPYGYTYYNYIYGYESSGNAVAIGDVQSSKGDSDESNSQIAFVGDVSYYTDTYGYAYGTSVGDIRTFQRDDNGTFRRSQRAGGQSSAYAFDSKYTSTYGYQGQYYYYGPYTTYGKDVKAMTPVPPQAGFGAGTSIAVGDVDNDGFADMIVGTDRHRAALVHIDRSAIITYSYSGYYGSSVQYRADGVLYAGTVDEKGKYAFDSATRVFLGFQYSRYDEYEGYSSSSRVEDRTWFRMPPTGTPDDEQGARVPAFHAEDVKLGDIDNDGDLDLVVTWPEPTTVTAYGLQNGAGTDDARVATRILTNDGTGFFADDTAGWLSGGSKPEYWQGHRCALADLDGDEDLDLLILLRQSTDAYLGKPSYGSHALRVLRNDGAGTGFVDVTADVLPSVPLAGTLDDNLRGNAIRVQDVNSDGVLDVLISTAESLSTSDGENRARSTRLLVGAGDGTLRDGTAFLPPVSEDSGEADDLQFAELTDSEFPHLISVSAETPVISNGGRKLRAFDWKR